MIAAAGSIGARAAGATPQQVQAAHDFGRELGLAFQVLVAPAEVPADDPAYDLLWRACFRWHVWPRQATDDKV